MAGSSRWSKPTPVPLRTDVRLTVPNAHDLMAAVADLRLFHALVKAGHVDFQSGDAALENAFLGSVALLETYVRAECERMQQAELREAQPTHPAL